MTKADLVKGVAVKIGLTKKKAAEAVDALFDTIRDALKRGEKVQLVGFGRFYIKSRPARDARNPKTGEAIKIAAKKIPLFKPGGGLRNAVK
jgi:DNA-binding protein HU-beta